MSNTDFGLTASDLQSTSAKRTPCVLLLDTSYSMHYPPPGGSRRQIDLLNEALPQLQKDLSDDSTASVSVELAVISFGGSPKEVMGFTPVDAFHPPPLSPEGGTPLGDAVLRALELIERRKVEYRQAGIAYFRPWIFILTDGKPDENQEWPVAVQRLDDAHRARKVETWALSTDPSPEAIALLQRLTPRVAVLTGFAFRETFKWLSASLTNQSKSKEGQAVPPAAAPSQIVPQPWTAPVQN